MRWPTAEERTQALLEGVASKQLLRGGEIKGKIWTAESIHDVLLQPQILTRGIRMVLSSPQVGTFYDWEKLESIASWGEQKGTLTARQVDAVRKIISDSEFAAAANLRAGNTASLHILTWDDQTVGFLLEAGPRQEVYKIRESGVPGQEVYYGDLEGRAPQFSDQRFFFPKVRMDRGSTEYFFPLLESASALIVRWAPRVVGMVVGDRTVRKNRGRR